MSAQIIPFPASSERDRDLEQVHPANNFVRLPDDLNLWTEKHYEGLARWYESAGDVRSVGKRSPGPLDDLSLETLMALLDVLDELEEAGERPV